MNIEYGEEYSEKKKKSCWRKNRYYETLGLQNKKQKKIAARTAKAQKGMTGDFYSLEKQEKRDQVIWKNKKQKVFISGWIKAQGEHSRICYSSIMIDLSDSSWSINYFANLWGSQQIRILKDFKCYFSHFWKKWHDGINCENKQMEIKQCVTWQVFEIFGHKQVFKTTRSCDWMKSILEKTSLRAALIVKFLKFKGETFASLKKKKKSNGSLQ